MIPSRGHLFADRRVDGEAGGEEKARLLPAERPEEARPV